MTYEALINGRWLRCDLVGYEKGLLYGSDVDLPVVWPLEMEKHFIVQPQHFREAEWLAEDYFALDRKIKEVERG